MARGRRKPETDTELLEFVTPGEEPVEAEPRGRKARRAAKKEAKADQKAQREAAKAAVPKRQGRFGVRSMGIAYEALQSLRGRSMRTWMTAIGIALGIAATVATVGLSSTSANAIAERFDATEATQVTVSFSNNMRDAGFAPSLDASERVRAINGVENAGILCTSSEERQASRTEARDYTRDVPVLGMEPGAMEAYGFTFVQGAAFDTGHVERDDKVAVIDESAARDLGYASLEGGPMIYLNGEEYALVGVYTAPEGEAKLTGAVIIPPTPCTTGDPEYAAAEVFIRTDLGAADKVAQTAPTAVFPEGAENLSVTKPSDLRNFRKGVQNEMQALLLGLAGVSLVIGAVSVSNTALVAVMERRSEIGLRRAVGAARRAVAMQFVWESTLIGLVGGIFGTVLGVNVTAIVSLYRDWQIVFDPMLFAAGPVIGAVVGVVAGVYPAWRASRIPPAVTLRA
ncbi:ABC transporter permease [Glycomyces algeriensis]|uniref:ABC transporter permease n=1 Tax=Glycomyces algeriensis TaxID=256037 RepID=A0A9W6G7J8_9ACTN|nr:ABC transporter permease [Glycomyces algeriensis]MDA1366155.1 ABC transporter permease [Glycomyces algeriensis]MDR7349076.1 putative ABC transport system permease protein [Glycomyces algeriensis]GLI41777.1 ABC transporter permease [Glycomyces algeriensis]